MSKKSDSSIKSALSRMNRATFVVLNKDGSVNFNATRSAYVEAREVADKALKVN